MKIIIKSKWRKVVKLIFYFSYIYLPEINYTPNLTFYQLLSAHSLCLFQSLQHLIFEWSIDSPAQAVTIRLGCWPIDTISCILCFRCQDHLKPRMILLLNIFISDAVIAVSGCVVLILTIYDAKQQIYSSSLLEHVAEGVDLPLQETLPCQRYFVLL